MDLQTVEQVARLARIELEEGTKERLAAQLGAILEHFRRLEELDTEGIEPAVYAVDLTGRTRSDEEGDAPDRDVLLGNTEHRRDGFYVVPRVIE